LFSVERDRSTSLRIYDITGRLVETLIDEQLKPGEYEINWSGSSHSTGVYFVRLSSAEKTQTTKIMLLK
jgi:flagellar hook assembly protein FlgD